MKFAALFQLLALALATQRDSNNERPATTVSSMQDSAEDVTPQKTTPQKTTPQKTYHIQRQFIPIRSPSIGCQSESPRLLRLIPILPRPPHLSPQASAERFPAFVISDMRTQGNTVTQPSPTPPSNPLPQPARIPHRPGIGNVVAVSLSDNTISSAKEGKLDPVVIQNPQQSNSGSRLLSSEGKSAHAGQKADASTIRTDQDGEKKQATGSSDSARPRPQPGRIPHGPDIRNAVAVSPSDDTISGAKKGKMNFVLIQSSSGSRLLTLEGKSDRTGPKANASKSRTDQDGEKKQLTGSSEPRPLPHPSRIPHGPGIGVAVAVPPSDNTIRGAKKEKLNFVVMQNPQQSNSGSRLLPRQVKSDRAGQKADASTIRPDQDGGKKQLTGSSDSRPLPHPSRIPHGPAVAVSPSDNTMSGANKRRKSSMPKRRSRLPPEEPLYFHHVGSRPRFSEAKCDHAGQKADASTIRTDQDGEKKQATGSSDSPRPRPQPARIPDGPGIGDAVAVSLSDGTIRDAMEKLDNVVTQNPQQSNPVESPSSNNCYNFKLPPKLRLKGTLSPHSVDSRLLSSEAKCDRADQEADASTIRTDQDGEKKQVTGSSDIPRRCTPTLTSSPTRDYCNRIRRCPYCNISPNHGELVYHLEHCDKKPLRNVNLCPILQHNLQAQKPFVNVRLPTRTGEMAAELPNSSRDSFKRRREGGGKELSPNRVRSRTASPVVRRSRRLNPTRENSE